MQFLVFVGKVAIAMVLALGLVDFGLRVFWPSDMRLDENFSAPLLTRIIARDDLQKRIVFLGDSALWGYGLDAQDAVPSLLAAQGFPVENLSYEGGSIANTYAMLRILLAHGVRPRMVVFNVNIKEFSPGDSAYRTLYPAVEQLAWPLLAPAERQRLDHKAKTTLDARLDRRIGGIWMLYGMRSDIRERIFGAADAATAVDDRIHVLSGEAQRAARAHIPTGDRFLGTYDLTPLDGENVEVFFLRRLCELVKTAHLHAVAILTPTNHVLLHEYIDTPDYDAQLAYVTKMMDAAGLTVLDDDRRFGTEDFLDNDHLTARGNALWAAQLARALTQ
jgi:lysophospholipase L1-like esterase